MFLGSAERRERCNGLICIKSLLNERARQSGAVL